MQEQTLPEVDPLNFAPRVKMPVLMLNGENDSEFPVESAQKPLFNLLGTGEKFKKRFSYPGGHIVPWQELEKESTFWFDKYLGPVK